MNYPFKVVTYERVEGYWVESRTLKARTAQEASGVAIRAAKRIGMTGHFAAAVVYRRDENGNWIEQPGVQIGRPNGSAFTITPQKGDWQSRLAENLGLKN